MVGYGNRPGKGAGSNAAHAECPGRAFDPGHHVFRAAVEGALQALEEVTRGNHSLGRLRSKQLPER